MEAGKGTCLKLKLPGGPTGAVGDLIVFQLLGCEGPQRPALQRVSQHVAPDLRGPTPLEEELKLLVLRGVFLVDFFEGVGLRLVQVGLCSPYTPQRNKSALLPTRPRQQQATGSLQLSSCGFLSLSGDQR